VSRVLADYPAAQIGLEPGDELVSFAGTDLSSLTSLSEFSNLVKTNKDQEVEVVFRKSSTGELLVKTVKIEEKNNQLLFGIGSLYYNGFYKAKDVFAGFSLAAQTTYNYTVETVRLLGELVQALLPQTQDRTALQMVSGPIGVSYFSHSVFNFSGIRGILELMALISISLAVFNLVPLPALDGGRMLIVIISHLLGKRSRKLEAVLISATMILMLILGLLVAWQDITRITQ
jgi:regulator of sigma E protease